MALSIDDIQNTYPLTAYNFRVTIGDESVRFASISGLQLKHKPSVYRHGMSWQTGPQIIKGPPDIVRLTLQRGIVRQDSFLLQWINTTHPQLKKRTLTIDLLDAAGVAQVRWTLTHALPVSLSAPDFDASSSEVAVESMEIVAPNMKVAFLENDQRR